jgi:hypothetical protein
MGLLPKKRTPQEWVDQPLPGFDEIQPKQVKEKSKKDEDDAEHKIKYRRYRGARSIICHDCAYEASSQGQDGQPHAALGPRSATYVRIYQGFERYLCNAHATHRRDMTDKNESSQ